MLLALLNVWQELMPLQAQVHALPALWEHILLQVRYLVLIVLKVTILLHHLQQVVQLVLQVHINL